VRTKNAYDCSDAWRHVALLVLVSQKGNEFVEGTNLSAFKERVADIRIVGLNNARTRKIDGSDVVYEVCFELSGIPTPAWGTLFEGEWKMLNATAPGLWQAANIDKGFLMMRCQLQEVLSLHLPFLKKAVAETNARYEHFVQELARERLKGVTDRAA
jgi:hypothetical protein